MAMTTLAPSAMPIKKLTTRLMTKLLAPTAATAIVLASPLKLPTTAISDALNSCSRMAVAATGSANCGMRLHSGPCRMSNFFD